VLLSMVAGNEKGLALLGYLEYVQPELLLMQKQVTKNIVWLY